MFGVVSARTRRSVSPSDRRANDAQLHMEIRRQHMRESQDRDEEVRVAPRRQLPTSIRNISAVSNAQRERRRRERIILGVSPVQPFLSDMLSNVHDWTLHLRLPCIWAREGNI